MDFIVKIAGKILKKVFLDFVFSKKVLNYGARPAAAQGLTDLQYAQQFSYRGDYTGALKAIEAAKSKVKSTAEYSYFRATLLKNLDDLQGAETSVQRAISLEANPKQLAVYNSELGQILAAQNRLQDAMQCFQTSSQLDPTRAAGMRDVAEGCLRMGYLDHAFEWAKRAVDADHHALGNTAHLAEQELHQNNLSADLATLAWVVAVYAKDAESVQAIAEESVSFAGYKNIALLGQVNYHLGLAYNALGDQPRSSQHWDRAARIDKQGYWGRSAQASLQGLAQARA